MSENNTLKQPGSLGFPLPQSGWIAEHQLRGYELGTEGNLKFTNCLHYLQDASEQHADSIGLGIGFLHQKRLLWVLSRYHIRLRQYPRLGDRVRVYSWPYGWQRLFALREFVFAAPQGTVFGTASSAWLLVSADDYKLQRPQEHLPAFPLHPYRAVDTTFAALPKPQNCHWETTFRVRMHDLDINRHVNNAVYVEWALEAVPQDCWSRFRPVEVEAQFAAMAFYGDSVRVLIESIGDATAPAYLHHIIRAADGLELSRLRSRWALLDPLA